jgi:hypothetical protein
LKRSCSLCDCHQIVREKRNSFLRSAANNKLLFKESAKEEPTQDEDEDKELLLLERLREEGPQPGPDSVVYEAELAVADYYHPEIGQFDTRL